VNTTVIQMGDVIDRGPRSLDAFECLNALQRHISVGNKIIRLVGSKFNIYLILCALRVALITIADNARS
jgi:hypothetical protein